MLEITNQNDGKANPGSRGPAVNPRPGSSHEREARVCPTINSWTAILAVILTIFALIAGALGFLGWSSWQEVRNEADRIRVIRSDMQAILLDVERTQILVNDSRDRSSETLVEIRKFASQAEEELWSTLNSLREELTSSVHAAESDYSDLLGRVQDLRDILRRREDDMSGLFSELDDLEARLRKLEEGVRSVDI